MSIQRLAGVVFLVVGVILLVVGLNASNSVADQVTDTFLGRYTQGTMWLIVGGLAMGLLGLLMVIFGVRQKGP